MKDVKNLKLQLKYWRLRRGLSIHELAAEAHVSNITISRIETGKVSMPRQDVVDRLAKGLHVSKDDLIVDEEEARHVASVA